MQAKLEQSRPPRENKMLQGCFYDWNPKVIPANDFACNHTGPLMSEEREMQPMWNRNCSSPWSKKSESHSRRQSLNTSTLIFYAHHQFHSCRRWMGKCHNKAELARITPGAMFSSINNLNSHPSSFKVLRIFSHVTARMICEISLLQ